MKKLAIYAAIVLLGACTQQEPTPAPTACGVANPVENLSWLRQQIMDTDIDVVTTATYQGKTYVNLYGYSWTCNTCRLYACDGTQVDFFNLSPTDQQELNKLLFAPEAQIIFKRQQ